MTGLLDFLTDPVAMARINEHRRLVLTLADRLGCSYEIAADWLAAQDCFAMEVFSEGSTADKPPLQ
jgi:hypothetical protein